MLDTIITRTITLTSRDVDKDQLTLPAAALNTLATGTIVITVDPSLTGDNPWVETATRTGRTITDIGWPLQTTPKTKIMLSWSRGGRRITATRATEARLASWTT